MDYESIIYDKKSSIAKIVLNKPDTGNTLDSHLAKELYSASVDAASDNNIKVLILTANGKLFCGGGNLKFLLSKKEKETIEKKLNELGLEESLINLKGLTPGMLVTLGEKKIKTLTEFAELATDELVGSYDEKNGKRFKVDGYLEEFALTRSEADNLILSARSIVFK